MKMIKKRTIILGIIFFGLLLTGCEIKKADYTASVSYAYDAIQENNFYYGQTKEAEGVVNARSALVQQSDFIEEGDGGKDANVNLLERSMEAGGEVFSEILGENIDVYGNNNSEIFNDPKPAEEDYRIDYSNIIEKREGTDEPESQESGENKTDETRTNEEETPDVSGEGEKTDNISEESEDPTQLDEGDAGGQEPTTEFIPDPEKAVALEVTGELGRYIWGELPDLSGLTVTAEYEDGHFEELTPQDYYINMHYPELIVPTFESGAFRLREAMEHNTINTYKSGKYNAEVIYQEVSANAEYLLWVKYYAVSIFHYCECLQPEKHNAVADENGRMMCRNKECWVDDPYGSGRKIPGLGLYVYMPMLYDYTFTEEDLLTDTLFWNRYFDVNRFYLSNFPVLQNKNVSIADQEGLGLQQVGKATLYDLRELCEELD